MLDIITLTLLFVVILGLGANAVAKDPGCALLFAFGAAFLVLAGVATGILSLGWWILPW